VPHDQTWILEHEEIVRGSARGQLLEVTKFTELREHF
jgi:hypothetical protein